MIFVFWMLSFKPTKSSNPWTWDVFPILRILKLSRVAYPGFLCVCALPTPGNSATFFYHVRSLALITPTDFLAILCFPDLTSTASSWVCPNSWERLVVGSQMKLVWTAQCLQFLSPLSPPWRNRQGEDSWLWWEFSICIISLWGSHRLGNRNRSMCMHTPTHTHTHMHLPLNSINKGPEEVCKHSKRSQYPHEGVWETKGRRAWSGCLCWPQTLSGTLIYREYTGESHRFLKLLCVFFLFSFISTRKFIFTN